MLLIKKALGLFSFVKQTSGFTVKRTVLCWTPNELETLSCNTRASRWHSKSRKTIYCPHLQRINSEGTIIRKTDKKCWSMRQGVKALSLYTSNPLEDDDDDDVDDDHDDDYLVPVCYCVMYLFGVDLVHIQKCSKIHCLLLKQWLHHSLHHLWLLVAVSLAYLAWPHMPLLMSAASQ